MKRLIIGSIDPETDIKERESIETLANVYSIILVTEYIEKAFARDAITAEEYTKKCEELIGKFKTFTTILGPEFDFKLFAQNSGLRAPAGLSRLIDIGAPATKERETKSSNSLSSNIYKLVAETAQLFVTVIDIVKLNQLSKDALHPTLSELTVNIAKASKTIYLDASVKETLKDWLVTLNKMSASEKLSETQARQLLFDIEHANSEFHRALSQ